MTDHVSPFTGRVALKWRDTGETVLKKSNVVTYRAADIAARLFAGDVAYAPSAIGFIYGDAASPAGLTDPDLLPANIRRAHTWETVATELADIGANIMICPLVPAPQVSRAADADQTMQFNEVTFASHTGIYSELGFSPGESGFADAPSDLSTVYIYGAVLLANPSKGIHIPVARTNFGAAPFTARPENREMSVFWTLTTH